MIDATAGPGDKSVRKPAPKKENFKETIEQLLIAFILAFIFRCFIVEAFVIPTGSMAPTLLGQHVDVRCSDCGYAFKANYSVFGDNTGLAYEPVAQVRGKPRILPLICPNCGYRIPPVNPTDPKNQSASTPVKLGDRILVLKFNYLFSGPHRWDVVVFKNPSDGNTRGGPDEVSPPTAFQDAYIKRLVGLPGETLMVLDGDVYVSNSTKPIDELTPDDFTVQHKPWAAQQALLRVVYDNDFHPQGLPREYTFGQQTFREIPWRQPWTASNSSWNTESRVFRFNGDAGSISFDRTAVPQTFPLTDWLTYAMTGGLAGDPRENLFFRPWDEPLYFVSDLMLAVTYRRVSGDGPVRLVLGKEKHEFIAEILPDSIALICVRPDGTRREIARARRNNIGSGAGTRIEFLNIDYRVSVRVDGQEILSTTPADFSPDVAELLERFKSSDAEAPVGKSIISPRSSPPPTVRIEAESQQCELKHVGLWRDVYYINRPGSPNHGRMYWAMPHGFPRAGSPGIPGLIRLGEDEYFVLGDNTRMSSDGRAWTAPINLPDEKLFVAPGRVPKRFLYGKAFFVYWPSGYRPIGQSPVGPNFPLIPNFGEMRFIH